MTIIKIKKCKNGAMLGCFLNDDNVRIWKFCSHNEMESMFGHFEGMFPGQKYVISYVRADGTKSTRWIMVNVLEFNSQGNGLVKSTDLEINELRTFRLDRIQEIAA